MSRCLVLLTVLLASCAGTRQVQIRSVTVPASVTVKESSAAELLAAAKKGGGSVRTWTVPVRVDGSFAYAKQKRSFFVSAYDKPTAPFRNAEPAEYESRMVGVSIKGRLENPSATNREVSVSFSDRKKTGVINWGQGMEQPVFKSCAIEASRVIDSAEWAVIGESQASPKDKDKDKEKVYILVKAP